MYESPMVTVGPQPRAWLWPNLLSLDAPIVAVLWQVLFVRCLHASLGLPTAILLASSVWLIYAADHALDAWTGGGDEPRHRFFRTHWRWVTPVWLTVLAGSAWIAWQDLPRYIFVSGAGIAALSFAYLVAIHMAPGLLSRPGWKEGAVAILFALGASLAAWPGVKTWADALMIAGFAVLCWINCVSIDDWEQGRPARRSTLIAAVAVVAMAGLLGQFRPVLAFVQTASVCSLVFLDRYWWRLPRELMRVLADVALLTPIFLLPLAGKI